MNQPTYEYRYTKKSYSEREAEMTTEVQDRVYAASTRLEIEDAHQLVWSVKQQNRISKERAERLYHLLSLKRRDLERRDKNCCKCNCPARDY